MLLLTEAQATGLAPGWASEVVAQENLTGVATSRGAVASWVSLLTCDRGRERDTPPLPLRPRPTLKWHDSGILTLGRGQNAVLSTFLGSHEV